MSKPAAVLAELCRRLVIDAFAPAAVLIDRNSVCLYSLGPTDRYLRLPPGQLVLPVYRTDRPLPSPHDLPRRFLLESGRSGAGEPADWDAAAHLSALGELVLAGGLDPTNVAAAISAVRPFGIDFSSGVEATRGVKDAVMIRNFVGVARASHAQATAPYLGVTQT